MDQRRGGAAGKAVSRWAILLRTEEERLLSELRAGGWRAIEVEGQPPPWTDDHANVLRALEVFSR